jgi:hypothetical protein
MKRKLPFDESQSRSGTRSSIDDEVGHYEAEEHDTIYGRCKTKLHDIKFFFYLVLILIVNYLDLFRCSQEAFG